jgi:hypothetical protein
MRRNIVVLFRADVIIISEIFPTTRALSFSFHAERQVMQLNLYEYFNDLFSTSLYPIRRFFSQLLPFVLNNV